MTKIIVYITTWQVPFDQVVQAAAIFKTEVEAVAFINEQAAAFWRDHSGDRDVGAEPWVPVIELGYDSTRFELWGGEAGFYAMLDAATYAHLHESHYAREYDAKGLERPGYLINAYAAGQKPGGLSKTEQAVYGQKAKQGLRAVFDYYKS